MSPPYYKALRSSGLSPYKGYAWSLPTEGAPGEWMPTQPAVVCSSGWHLATLDHLLEHGATQLYEAEGEIAFEQARLLRRVPEWNAANLRLFAADCAEHVLGLFEARYPEDSRPRQAIDAARCYARGESNLAQLRDAADRAGAQTAGARDAAQAAAWAAAGEVAEDPAREAAEAAGAAARYAAPAAEAAEKAERAWQVSRLAAYLRGEVAE